MNKSNKTINAKQKTELIRVIIGGILAELTAFLAYYLVYHSINNNPSYGEFSGLSAEISAGLIFGPVLFVGSILWLKFLRVRNWWAIGIIAALTTLIIYYNANIWYGFAWFFVLLIFLSLISFVCTWITVTKVRKKFSPLKSFLFTLIVVVGIFAILSIVLETTFTDYERQQYQRANSQNLNTGLQAIHFQVYMPEWLPSDLSIKRIQIPNPSSDVTFHAPTHLEYDTDPGGGKGLKVNEFTPSSKFNPPSDCGPYDASTLSVGPAGYIIPCKQVEQIGNIFIYLNKPTAVSPPPYNYYFVINGTEITVEDTIGNPLTQSDLRMLIDGLMPIAKTKLPTSILMQQF